MCLNSLSTNNPLHMLIPAISLKPVRWMSLVSNKIYPASGTQHKISKYQYKI